MKKKFTVILSAAAVICAALWLQSCRHHKEQARQEVPKVSVAEAVVDSVVVYNTYPGMLKANNTVELVGRVDGYLRSQNFTDGQLVEKGALLFTIEDTQYRDAVRQAEARLATARSNREYAAAQYQAMAKALESDAVSKMEVNKAKSALDESEASIRQAEAALQTARTNLSYCRITAPFRGHVSAPTLSVGAYVSGAGAPVTLATIYEDATLYAEFHIADKVMESVRAGLSGKSAVDLDSIPFKFEQPLSRQYAGRLTYVSPQVDASTGTLTLRAAVDNPDGDLHDGMYVTIDLPSSADPKAILVEDAAISTDQLGKYIFAVNDSNRVVYTPITAGALVLDSMRVVTAGVRPGERYVNRALLKVRDGMTVEPVLQPRHK